ISLIIRCRNCMKLPNHPCHTPAQPPTQTAQRGHRSASPGIGRVLRVNRVRRNLQSIGDHLIEESNGDRCREWLSFRLVNHVPNRTDAQLPQDDETGRLRAALEPCRAEELAAADQLSKPRHSLLYPAYT